MHIHFFIQVMTYLKQVSENGVLLKKYMKLEDILKEAIKNPVKDFSEEIAAATVQLVTHLLQNDPGTLGNDANRLLEIIDNNRVYGKRAADFIEGLLASKDTDYAAIQAEINKKIKLLSKHSNAIGLFYEIFDQLILTDLLNLSIKDELISGLNIRFEGQVAVRNINDLERYTRIWDGILQSFTELTGYNKQELEFGNLQNGIIVLGVETEGINLEAFMKGTMGIMNSMNLIMKIRKIQIEISQLPINNDCSGLLEDEIQIILNQSSSEVAADLINNYYKGFPENSVKVSENLSRSLKQIMNFIEMGGKLECKPSPDIVLGDELCKGFNESFINLEQLSRIIDPSQDKKTSMESEFTHTY